MEIGIKVTAGLIYMSLFLGSVFCAYFFWRSVDGELRKIMIRKYVCSSLFFLVTTITVLIEPVRMIAILSPVCIPYLWQKVQLIKFLIKK